MKITITIDTQDDLFHEPRRPVFWIREKSEEDMRSEEERLAEVMKRRVEEFIRLKRDGGIMTIGT